MAVVGNEVMPNCIGDCFNSVSIYSMSAFLSSVSSAVNSTYLSLYISLPGKFSLLSIEAEQAWCALLLNPVGEVFPRNLPVYLSVLLV